MSTMSIQGTEVNNSIAIEDNIYTTFSGADCIPYIDGEGMSQMYSIDWQDLGEHDGLVVGTVGFVLFYDAVEIIKPGRHTLHLNFKNEYGGEMDLIFDDIFFKKPKSGISMDDIAMRMTYEFTATKPRHIPGPSKKEEAQNE